MHVILCFSSDEHSEYGISNATWRSSSSSLSSNGSRDGSNMSLDRSNLGNQSSNTTFSTNTDHTNYAHDSDIDEDNFSEADWSSHVPSEVLSNLSDIEKKRQEIINGESFVVTLLEYSQKSFVLMRAPKYSYGDGLCYVCSVKILGLDECCCGSLANGTYYLVKVYVIFVRMNSSEKIYYYKNLNNF